MLDDVLEKWNVRLQTPDAELPQGAVHAVPRQVPVVGGGDDLYQEGIVVRRDHRSGVSHASVEPDPEAAGRPIGQDAAVVRRELVFRIFGRQAALNRVAIARHLLLEGHPNWRSVQRVPLGDQDLRAHEVEAGDDFGDRVLHLDPGVHLDEEPPVRVQVVKKLDRAGIIVANFLRHPRGGFAEVTNNLLWKPVARGHFNDLLVPALDGTIAFVKMDDIPVLVPKHLNLDVLGMRDVLLEEHGGIAKGAPGFGLSLVQQTFQVRRLGHHPHPAASATERRFDNQREADFARRFERLFTIGQRLFRARQSRHIDTLGQGARGGLVSHLLQQFRPRTDKNNARPLASPGELGIFTEEPVSWMNGLHPDVLRQVNDPFDVEVSRHRPFAGTNLVRLIRFEAMDAQPVFLGVNGDRPEAKVGCRAEDPDGDLGSVRSH